MVEVTEDLSQIKEPHLKWDLERFSRFTRAYDSKRDVFFAYEEPKRPAISMDVGGVWERFDPKTEDVIAVEIQDIESIFLKRHPEFVQGWEVLKPSITKTLRRADDTSVLAEFLRFLLFKLQEWLNNERQKPPARRAKPA